VTEPFSLPLDRVPDLVSVVAAHPARYRFLLESTASGPLGTHSILLRSGDAYLERDSKGKVRARGVTLETRPGDGFLDQLKTWYRSEYEQDGPYPDFPFAGGWFVYLSYELAGEIEPVLDLPASDDGLPTALAVRCEGAIIIRHGQPEKAWLVAESQGLLEIMQSELSEPGERQSESLFPRCSLEPDKASRFTDAIQRIQRYLEGGDVFQVNLSRAWRGKFAGPDDPIGLYRRLKHCNPAPFAGLMRWADRTLLSSSPERLVELRGREAQTRPIAGTYPRGHDSITDAALSRDMLAHPKERAEHIMLIDLERNDLGRVCEAGSVEVSELMVVESYAHVHHIVSNVKGTIRAEVTPADVIRAVFPGGTITGCPKVRCMEIIAELEQQGRGFYTGSMGYISRDGQMDLNILIRSMLLNGREVSLRTGAGIVADSDPGRELEETVAKARGLLMALETTDD
jgi:anthranilate synthase component 1